jgi:RNA polymerase subunit RPABC4/transcription elongation factor Spt4
MKAQSGKMALLLILFLVMVFMAFVLTPFALAPLGVFTGLAHGAHGAAMNVWHFRPWFPVFPALGLAFLFLILWIAVIIWVYKDAEQRGMSGLLWSLLVFFGHLIGLIVFLIVRQDHPACCGAGASRSSAPPATGSPSPPAAGPASEFTCPSCKRPVEKGFAYCPHCGAALQPVCKSCGKPVDAAWKVCPYCGATLKSE